jgi:hypothetical protein
MSGHVPTGLPSRPMFGDLTTPGRSSFDWAVLFAAAALVIPLSGLVGLVFADRSRRKGYGRWKAALAAVIWCTFLGVVFRGFLNVGLIP